MATVRVMKPSWAWFLLVVGILGVVAGVFFIVMKQYVGGGGMVVSGLAIALQAWAHLYAWRRYGPGRCPDGDADSGAVQ